MKKSELVQVVADRMGRPQQEIKACLDTITSVITEAVVSGERVTVLGFGTFSRVWAPPRRARNPRSGRLLQLHPRYHARFAPGATLTQQLKALIPIYDDNPEHVKARRVARTLAADLRLYHQDLIDEARRSGQVGEALQEVLASLQETFVSRVPPEITEQRNYLEEELYALLRKGRSEPSSYSEQAS